MITTVAHPNTTGAVVLLNSIATGTDATNRIGRRINVKAVDCMYAYQQTAASLGGQVALVYDCQPDGTTPSYNVIFDTSSGGAGMAFKDTLQNAKRFKIFWFDLLPTPGQPTSSANLIQNMRHYVKVPEQFQACQYNATGAATPNTGGWYLCYGDSTNTTTNTNIIYNVKLQFTDG